MTTKPLVPQQTRTFYSQVELQKFLTWARASLRGQFEPGQNQFIYDGKIGDQKVTISVTPKPACYVVDVYVGCGC